MHSDLANAISAIHSDDAAAKRLTGCIRSITSIATFLCMQIFQIPKDLCREELLRERENNVKALHFCLPFALWDLGNYNVDVTKSFLVDALELLQSMIQDRSRYMRQNGIDLLMMIIEASNLNAFFLKPLEDYLPGITSKLMILLDDEDEKVRLKCHQLFHKLWIWRGRFSVNDKNEKDLSTAFIYALAEGHAETRTQSAAAILDLLGGNHQDVFLFLTDPDSLKSTSTSFPLYQRLQAFLSFAEHSRKSFPRNLFSKFREVLRQITRNNDVNMKSFLVSLSLGTSLEFAVAVVEDLGFDGVFLAIAALTGKSSLSSTLSSSEEIIMKTLGQIALKAIDYHKYTKAHANMDSDSCGVCGYLSLAELVYEVGTRTLLIEQSRSLCSHIIATAAAYVGNDRNLGIMDSCQRRAKDIVERLISHNLSWSSISMELLNTFVIPFFQKESSDGISGARWKESGAGSTQLMLWISECAELDESLIRILCPFSLKLVDDHETRYKMQGIEVFMNLLRSEKAVLQVSNSYGDVVFESIRPCLAFLSDPDLFDAAFHAMEKFVDVVESGPTLKRNTKLEVLMDEGILRGLAMSIGTKRDVLFIILKKAVNVIRRLDTTSILYLEPLLSLVLEVSSVHLSDVSISCACCDVLDELILQCWPRIRHYRGAILVNVLKMANEINRAQARKSRTKATETLSQKIQQVVKDLAEATNGSLKAQLELVREKDPGLYAICSGNNN